jgi:hypothetical protein
VGSGGWRSYRTGMKVVVVGGNGHLGALAVRALRRAGPSVEVVVASRRGPLRVDLADPTTFGALDGATVVVDVANATASAPDALARHCLERGIVFVESTSDAAALARLAALRAEGPGAVVLGAGIFTGVSNLLAREAVRAARSARSVLLAISSSPYSAAGSGTIDLMTAAMARPSVRWRAGARTEGPNIERGPRVRFPSGELPSLRMSFAEQEMIGPSTGVPDADVVFAPRPSLLVAAFLLLPGALLRAGWFRWCMNAYFVVLRKWLLGFRRSAVEIVAEVEGEGAARRAVRAADGMAAGGNAIAAIALALGRRALAGEPPRGVRFVDQELELGPVVELANSLAAGDDERLDAAPAEAGEAVLLAR